MSYMLTPNKSEWSGGGAEEKDKGIRGSSSESRLAGSTAREARRVNG